MLILPFSRTFLPNFVLSLDLQVLRVRHIALR
jgi:hypothetical protein